MTAHAITINANLVRALTQLARDAGIRRDAHYRDFSAEGIRVWLR
jgi:DNA-binding phage protein